MLPAPLHRALTLIMTVAALIAAWEVLCRALHIPSFLIPAPSQVAWRLYEKRDLYLIHTWTTLYETTAGFLLAVVFGIVCAAVIVVIPKLRDVVMPLLLLAQLVPKVAIAPLLLIWFGYGLFPKVLVAFLVAFFPIVVNGASGLASVQPELLDLGSSLQASRWQTFWKFRIPSALPELFSGMKIAVTLAIIGAIIGEFVGGNRGLGYLIIVANQELDTPLAFAAIFLLSAAGIALYAVIEMLERMLIPWHAPSSASPAASHSM
ncbi:MAG TPA: ABC transporter permease [Xanthobacteraceae bacterium]|jgi:NitT/TauT family transport system permease protein